MKDLPGRSSKWTIFFFSFVDWSPPRVTQLDVGCYKIFMVMYTGWGCCWNRVVIVQTITTSRGPQIVMALTIWSFCGLWIDDNSIIFSARGWGPLSLMAMAKTSSDCSSLYSIFFLVITCGLCSVSRNGVQSVYWSASYIAMPTKMAFFIISRFCKQFRKIRRICRCQRVDFYGL